MASPSPIPICPTAIRSPPCRTRITTPCCCARRSKPGRHRTRPLSSSGWPACSTSTLRSAAAAVLAAPLERRAHAALFRPSVQPHLLDDLLAEPGTARRARPALSAARPHRTVSVARDASPLVALPHPLRQLPRHHAAASAQFLHGSPAEVEARLDHCAPRMFVRLSMAGVPKPHAASRRCRRPLRSPAAVPILRTGRLARTRRLKRIVASRLRGQDPASLCGGPTRSCLPCLPPSDYAGRVP